MLLLNNLWVDYFARVGAQVCHDCVVVLATLVKSELSLFQRSLTMEKLRDRGWGFNTPTFKMCESSLQYLLFLCMYLAVSGVRSTMNCWPAAPCNSGALILSTYVRETFCQYMQEQRYQKHKSFIKFRNFAFLIVYTMKLLLKILESKYKEISLRCLGIKRN